ncbi:MAG: DUF4838 domain-containing protein, partial [Pirellulaceae bacterium]
MDAWDLGKPAASTWVTPTCMTVSPGDKAVTCYCKECRATMATAGGTAVKGGSTVMGLFTKRICEEVKKRWPDKKVVLYASEHKAPPGLKFPDNLVVAMDLRCDLGLMGQPEVRREWDDIFQG